MSFRFPKRAALAVKVIEETALFCQPFVVTGASIVSMFALLKGYTSARREELIAQQLRESALIEIINQLLSDKDRQEQAPVVVGRVDSPHTGAQALNALEKRALSDDTPCP